MKHVFALALICTAVAGIAAGPAAALFAGLGACALGSALFLAISLSH